MMGKSEGKVFAVNVDLSQHSDLVYHVVGFEWENDAQHIKALEAEIARLRSLLRTRYKYNRLANALAETPLQAEELIIVARAIAKVLKESNPRFQESRFVEWALGDR